MISEIKIEKSNRACLHILFTHAFLRMALRFDVQSNLCATTTLETPK